MKKVPFEFVIEALEPLELRIKPMFGAHGVYHGEKILLILRKKNPPDENTGVWFGLPEECVSEVKSEFPILKDLTLFGKPPTNWQVLRESEVEFEETAIAICELIKKKDKRFGRVFKQKVFGKKKIEKPKKIKVKMK